MKGHREWKAQRRGRKYWVHASLHLPGGLREGAGVAAREVEFALLLGLAVVGVPRVGGGVLAVQLAVLPAGQEGAIQG